MIRWANASRKGCEISVTLLLSRVIFRVLGSMSALTPSQGSPVDLPKSS